MQAQHAFVCERNEEKMRFLHSQLKPIHSFGDVSDLAQHTAYDVVTKMKVVVPWATFFWAGFSCRSRTPLSSKAGQNVNCLQRHDSSAETSYTFDHIYGYIARVRPQWVILENVVGLMAKPSQDAQSDADFVLESLSKAGYVAKLFQFDCEDFGSKASRNRLYFLGWLVQSSGPALGATSAEYDVVSKQLEGLDSLLQHLVIGSMPTSLFVKFPVEAALAQFSMLATIDQNTKAVEKDKKWHAEHLDEFRSRNLDWPADLSKVEAGGEGFTFRRWGLSDRAAELLFFVHVTYPYDMMEAEVEFVDCNPTIKRLVAGGSSPWKATCQTLTGGAHPCVRYLFEGVVIVRPLTPVEAFALIGWDQRVLRSPVACSQGCMLSLAGNAFSAFAFLPCLMLAFMGAGMLHSLPSSCLLPKEAAPTVEGGADHDSEAESVGSSADESSLSA